MQFVSNYYNEIELENVNTSKLVAEFMKRMQEFENEELKTKLIELFTCEINCYAQFRLLKFLSSNVNIQDTEKEKMLYMREQLEKELDAVKQTKSNIK